MSIIWAFDDLENMHNLYCGDDCIMRFCSSLRKHAKSVKKKKKKKELKSHQDATK